MKKHMCLFTQSGSLKSFKSVNTGQIVMSKYNSEEGCPSCGEGGVSTLGGISEAARDGARNYRSEAAKLTAAELLIHWSGLNKPYTSNNIKDLDKCYDYDVGHAMLEDDKYKMPR
ncbi:hypothetical protein WJX77_001665 [Trebouxia sp. C0004]